MGCSQSGTPIIAKPIVVTTPQYIDCDIEVHPDALSIINTLHSHHYEAYLVGGAIRDILQHKVPKDYDIVTNATPEQIVKLFKFARIIGRRFQIVHVYLSRKEFIEISTYRGVEQNTGMLRRDNVFGEIDTDANRRDFTINSLYYDVVQKRIIDWHGSLDDLEHKRISPIGDVSKRFSQDPVRMLRAIRFMSKLNFELHPEIINTIASHKELLLEIPPARLFEECIKLFSCTEAYRNYKLLRQFEIFELLFPYTCESECIVAALKNTEQRLRQGLPSSPAFMFVIFLFESYQQKFKILAKTHKNKKKASEKAMQEIIYKQNKRVQIPQFAMQKITNTWALQHILERIPTRSPKSAKELVRQKEFRMAFDFLSIRSEVNAELTSAVEFWHKIQ